MDALDGSDCTKVDSDASGAAITTLFNALRAGQGLDPIAPLRAGDCQSLDATLPPTPRAESFDQDNVSWRAGVDFKPPDDVLLYANVSRGHKAGRVPRAEERRVGIECVSTCGSRWDVVH